MAKPPTQHINAAATDVKGAEDNERLDCGHYEYLSKATPTPGGGLLCKECAAKLWLLQNAPVQPLEEEPRASWRESLERLFAALH
jgi:hypothetical protein